VREGGVLLASLAIAWFNYAFTARWADVPGALHGAREPWFVAALSLATLAALTSRAGKPVDSPALARATAIAGALLLGGIFFVWFPPSSWTRIPFLDNWPARYQSAIEQIDRFNDGFVVGWQWYFLGGYHLSSDLTVSLGLLAWLPVSIFGGPIGFHLLHALLFAALPLLVWLDLRREDRQTAAIAAGLTAVISLNYSYMLLRSGDTNSLGAAVLTLLVLTSASAMRRTWWGGPLLVVALAALLYTHAGFIVFVGILLAIDSCMARSVRHTVRVTVALIGAMLASLPLWWEAARYPAWFTLNNATLRDTPVDWAAFATKVYYNLELMVRPGRWMNDYTGLAMVLLPILILAAWRASGRPRFYALAGLAMVATVRFYDPVQFGWGMLRAIHLYPLFLGVVLAWFIREQSGSARVGATLIATVALYIQVQATPIPHVAHITEFDRALVERLQTIPDGMVLLENSYHPDMDVSADRATEPTPFPAHFEALLTDATHHRFYAGLWDGWQWSPARRHLLANGALGGVDIARIDDATLTAELRKWGVGHLLVWSERSRNRLANSTAFDLRWSTGRWHHFELRDADLRSVATPTGSGRLHALDPLGATIDLEDVTAGERVVIRTNYYPAWRLTGPHGPVPTLDVDGQLAFDAPASGDLTLQLSYPRYRWTMAVAVAGLVLTMTALVIIRSVPTDWRIPPRRGRQRPRT
jgi:hypothetical protein